jgi:hypothetical protein
MDRGVLSYLAKTERLVLDLDRLAQEPIGDEAAKAAIFDAVYQGIVPQRLLPDVAANYFEAEQREYLDCASRTRFGLHNAFTRAIKALDPAPAFRGEPWARDAVRSELIAEGRRGGPCTPLAMRRPGPKPRAK